MPQDRVTQPAGGAGDIFFPLLSPCAFPRGKGRSLGAVEPLGLSLPATWSPFRQSRAETAEGGNCVDTAWGRLAWMIAGIVTDSLPLGSQRWQIPLWNQGGDILPALSHGCLGLTGKHYFPFQYSDQGSHRGAIEQVFPAVYSL